MEMLQMTYLNQFCCSSQAFRSDKEGGRNHGGAPTTTNSVVTHKHLDRKRKEEESMEVLQNDIPQPILL